MYRKAILSRRWTNSRGSLSNGLKTTRVNQQGGKLVTLEIQFFGDGYLSDEIPHATLAKLVELELALAIEC